MMKRQNCSTGLLNAKEVKNRVMIKKVVCTQTHSHKLVLEGNQYIVTAIYTCKCKTDNMAYDVGVKGGGTHTYCEGCGHDFPVGVWAICASLFADLDEWQEAEESVNELMKELEVVNQ